MSRRGDGNNSGDQPRANNQLLFVPIGPASNRLTQFRVMAYASLAGARLINLAVFSTLRAIYNHDLGRARLSIVSFSNAADLALGAAFMVGSGLMCAQLKRGLSGASMTDVRAIRAQLPKLLLFCLAAMVIATAKEFDRAGLFELSIEAVLGAAIAVLPLLYLTAKLPTVTADVTLAREGGCTARMKHA